MELWYGGLATIIKEIIAEKGIKDVKLRTYGYSDTFIEHGSTKELEKIDAHTRIKILSLPDLDYLNNDEAIKRLREWCYSWKMKL